MSTRTVWWAMAAAALLLSACDGHSNTGVIEPMADVPVVDTGNDLGVQDAGQDAGLDAPPLDVPVMDVAMEVAVDVPSLCRTSADCMGNAGGPVCDTASGRCVACLSTEDVCPNGQFCDSTSRSCLPGCRNDQGCSSADGGVTVDGSAVRVSHCDVRNRSCVECVTDEHCPAGTLCVGAVCVMGCNAQRPCGAGQTCCDGACVDSLANTAHCGACGNRCVLPNGTPTCQNGVCAVGQCTSPFENCDAMAANGCETNTLNTVAHCGGCGMACPMRANATSTCAAGVCGFTCATGFADCDGNAANGCETNLQTDVMRCGSCSTVCNPPNGTPACTGGQCTVGRCEEGFGNCDGNATNGCESDTRTSTTHCGMCGRACPARANAFPGCLGGTCVTSCVMGFQDCDGNEANGCEVDLRTSAANCGACGRACAPPRATGMCTAGRCAIVQCEAGFADCDNDPANGCEVDTRVDPNHCAGCGRVCMASGGTPICRAGVCAVGACAAGRGDCDSNAGNGCEVNLTNDTANCGTCGTACALANASAVCTNGRCAVGACTAGFADCDSNPTNGCETDLRSTVGACGACGRACTIANGTPACNNGACAVAACNTGFADCDGNPANGCEVDLRSSTSSCGMCGNACSVPNASPSCQSGRCVIGACNGGFSDCDSNAANGCETSTASDPRSCGACGRVCNLANVAAATCSGGSCGIAACASGFADCDGNPANGCEVDLGRDPANCGSCRTRCNSNLCREGSCQVFGGAYENSDAPCTNCSNGNPLFNNVCGCPSGFNLAQNFRVINDCAGRGTRRGANILVCANAGPSDWAGGYQRDDAVNCGQGCRAPNPFTGSCSCPGGTTPVEFRVVTDGPGCNGVIGSHVGMCVSNSGPRPSFGGAYEVDDAVSGGVGCRRANPVTGACSCPSGFTAGPLRVEVDSSAGIIGSLIVVCTR